MSKQEKLRVYEYAKSLNMSSKEIITILKRMNVRVSNHMSVMEPEMVEKVEQFFRDIKASAAARHAREQEHQAKVADRAPAEPNRERGDARPKSGSQAKETTAVQAARPTAQQQKREGGGKAQQPARQAPAGGQGPARPQGQAAHAAQAESQQQRPASQAQPNRAAQEPSRGRAISPRLQDDDDKRSFDETLDLAGSIKEKTTKKTKSSGKRFDDHKISSLKPGGPIRPGSKKAKNNQNRKQQPAGKVEKVDNTPKKIIVRGPMTVGELARALHKDAAEVIKKLLFLGVMATINKELDLDAIQLVADEFKVEVELKLPVEEDPFEMEEEPEDESVLEHRPPVVTIMGHVDHGKTTLLDSIRHSNVAAEEAGGITQHIGAYQVEINGKKITFLDTPGHEAFTMMRARGATVTDIAVLVVAADDGVMPQTVEAINHAKAAQVPIIVAINKIDKPEANPERIKQELMEYGLVPEEWGGDTIFVNVSAKQKINLDELLEMILLVAEVEDLKANPNRNATGTVLEAELDKGRGPVARVLVQTGTLKVGDPFVAGVCFGRVRAMVNDRGRRMKEAGPSTPVEITGLTEVPQAGDRFIVFEDERKAREIAEKRATKLKQTERSSGPRVTLDDLYKHIKEGQMKELNVIIKADVQGSVEALRGSLEKINVEGVRIRIIHAGVGAITESDIILASASNAIVIGFNVRPEPAAKQTAEQEKVDVRLHRIIYKVIEEIEAAMKGMLDPEYTEKIIGQAEVRETFKISKVGTIAGCYVTEGKITRNSEVRIIRNGIVVHEGSIQSLKRFKDDAREVLQGFECGISLEKFNDIKEGDIIEAYELVAVER